MAENILSTSSYTTVNYYKYYSKDISNLNLNSRFMNNNQPINKSLYFNVSDYNNSEGYVSRQNIYMYKYPSLIVDNNNTIHVIANLSSYYRHNNNWTNYRNYHFLTTEDASYKMNIKTTAITKSDKSLTTSSWSNIRDFILSDSSNSQTALYSLCYQFTGYDNWYVFNNQSSPRLIM